MLMMLKKNRRYLFCLFILFLPIFASADVQINEVMYDLDGSDTDREWIEILNSGESSVLISNYSFRENDTNHKLESVEGGSEIPPSGYAVIVDNVQKFKVDNPQFSGILIDSTFSLSNTGETLSIVKGDDIIDTVSYTDKDGASGDGKTLNRDGSGWLVRSKNPGGGISEGASVTTSKEINDTSVSTISTVIEEEFEPQVHANAGTDKEVLAGTNVMFEGKAIGIKKELIPSARFRWNFGDGVVKEGKNISHLYIYPGKYIVSLNVISGEYSEGDTVKVTVLAPELLISKRVEGNNGYIEISNESSKDVNVSGLMIRDKNYNFAFPEGTILASKNKTRFLNSITGIKDVNNTTLVYANGVEITPEKSVVTPAKQNNTTIKTVEIRQDSISPIKSKIEPNEVIGNAASADLFDSSKSSNGGDRNLYYILGVLGMTFLAFAVFYLERVNRKKSEIERQADEYEILEKI